MACATMNAAIPVTAIIMVAITMFATVPVMLIAVITLVFLLQMVVQREEEEALVQDRMNLGLSWFMEIEIVQSSLSFSQREP